MTSSQDKAMPPVSIVGAGIGGLTLGRALLKHGVPAILYDRAASKPRHTYAITLHASTYRPLLKILDVDEATFKSKLAVDASINGVGSVSKGKVVHWGKGDEGSMRVNRSKFEVLLREGLDIRWESGVDRITVNNRSAADAESGEGIDVILQDATKVQTKTLIAADGVHSTIRRQLLPTIEPKVLPFVAFNGKRRIPREKFQQLYAPNMSGSNVIEYKRDKVVLNISIAEIEPERTSITWTYSRPESGSSDALYKPNRPQAGATEIPDEFFAEVSELSQGEGLPQPFADVFDVEVLRKERILHWLMRSVHVPEKENLVKLAEQGVVFLGDSVHAEPILGGEGANEVISDALDLADRLSKAGGGGEGIVNFYDRSLHRWSEGVDRSERHIGDMH